MMIYLASVPTVLLYFRLRHRSRFQFESFQVLDLVGAIFIITDVSWSSTALLSSSTYYSIKGLQLFGRVCRLATVGHQTTQVVAGANQKKTVSLTSPKVVANRIFEVAVLRMIMGLSLVVVVVALSSTAGVR